MVPKTATEMATMRVRFQCSASRAMGKASRVKKMAKPNPCRMPSWVSDSIRSCLMAGALTAMP